MNFMHVRKLCNYIFFIIIINRFVTIVICLLLAEPLKRVFLTLTIICRNIRYKYHTKDHSEA